MASAYSAAVLADSPTAFYPMNETSGTVMTDASGNGHNGTYVGSPTLNQAGPKTGSASVAFTGSTPNYATLPIVLPAPPFSVELWFYGTVSTASEPLLAQGVPSSSNKGFAFLDDSADFKANIGTGSGFVASASGTASINAWHHAVFTIDASNNYAVYVDGSSVWTGAPSTISVDTSTLLSIAAYTGSPSSTHFTGSISNVSIYPTVLSSTRVTAHYNASMIATRRRVSSSFILAP